MAVLQQLAALNLALAVAILVVRFSGPALRRAFGVRAAYTAWAAVPAVALAGFLPRMNFPGLGLAGNLPLALSPSQGGLALGRTAPGMAPILTALWLTGVVALAVVLGLRQAAYLSWLGSLTPSRHHPRLMTAARAGAGPAVVGLLKPRIIIGADFETAFSPDERALIFAHEQMHIERGDVLVNTLAAAARCAFWFNPLVHWGAHLIRSDQELACDAAVLQRFPGRRKTYGELLLKSQFAARPVPIGCHWPANSGRLLKKRIVMLKAPIASKTRSAAGFATAAVLTLALGAGAWAAEQGASVSGSWRFLGDITASGHEAVAKPLCKFKQSGSQLSGTCEGPGSEGPATGKIEGQHISWQWTHKPRNKAGAPAGVSTFDGVISADQLIHGTWSYSGMKGAKGPFYGQRE